MGIKIMLAYATADVSMLFNSCLKFLVRVSKVCSFVTRWLRANKLVHETRSFSIIGVYFISIFVLDEN